jgi:DNA-binding PadR family transcriptional regulator
MQWATTRYDALDAFRISEKAATLMMEIGLDEVATATSFIDYFCSKYGVSKSGAWYCLKKLKKAGLVEFTEKGESYKPLSLTPGGVELLRRFRGFTIRPDLEGGAREQPRRAIATASVSAMMGKR